MFSGSSNYVLNFGPQHPAAHGVLRLLVESSGESVISADPHIGFLHRGTENLIENNTYFQAIPYFDSLDYVSTLPQEHAYILSLELLCNIFVTAKVNYFSIVMDEITRLLNHIMCITTHALDVGALTPFLWGFEESENLIYFYEFLTGASMHTAAYRLGSLSVFPSNSFFKSMLNFVDNFVPYIDSLDDLLSYNPIWLNSLDGVGFVSRKDSILYGFTGPVLRASGMPWDLSNLNPYENYQALEFDVAVSSFGDSFARYNIRLLEMSESCNIIVNSIRSILSDASDWVNVELINNTSKFNFFNSHKVSMEELILGFKANSSGLLVNRGSAYSAVEAPNGEMGVTVVSDGSPNPWRCKVSAPGFFHLSGLTVLTNGCLLADLVGIIGSLDIVFGEIDR